MAKRTLLVTDTGVTRFQLKNMLKQEGYQVFEANRGRIVIRDSFDREMGLQDMHLVILDMYLSDLDGIEVLRHIKVKHPPLPVIVVSSEPTREEILEILDIGATDYLVKPVEKKDFIKRVSQALEATPTRKTSSTEAPGMDELLATLPDEIQRSIRSNSPLVVVSVRGQKKDLDNYYSAAASDLRRIDGAYHLENQVILVLPATAEEGCEVVQKKLFQAISDETSSDDLLIKTLVLPRDADEEQVQNYQFEKITDFVMKSLSR